MSVELNGEFDALLKALEGEVEEDLQAGSDIEPDAREDGLANGVEEIIRKRTAEIMEQNDDERFKPAGEEKEYSLAKMRDHQQEILRLLSTGMKPHVIAKILDIHPQTVSNVRNDPLAQAMLGMLHAERNITISKTAERVDALAPLAAEIFEDIMTDDDADQSLQYRVARDTLKANGILVETKKIIGDSPYLTGDEVTDLKDRFKKDFGEEITDVKFAEVEVVE